MKKEELKRIKAWCDKTIESLNYVRQANVPEGLSLLHSIDKTFDRTIMVFAGIDLISEALKIPVHIETDPGYKVHFQKVVKHHGIRFVQLSPYAEVR